MSTQEQQTPEANTGADAAEAASWAALRQEIEGGDEGGEENAQLATNADGTEGASEGDDGGDAGQAPPEAVPFQQYENVQKALRAARENERRANEQLSGINQLLQTLRNQRQQPAKQEAEAPALPSKDEDPIGYFEAVINQQKQELEALKRGTTQTQEQLQMDQQQRAFWNAVVQSESEIRRTAPDYDEATAHLEAGRVAELKAIYADDNPAAIALANQYGLRSVEDLRAAILNQDRISVAQQALSLGMSPAQLYYNLAKQRGYQPKEPAGGKLKTSEIANQVIEAARRGQKAARTLNGGTGGGPDNDISIAELTDLYSEDPEAFDREWDKAARKGLLG